MITSDIEVSGIETLEDRVARLEAALRQRDAEIAVERAMLGRRIDQLVEMLRRQKTWLEAEVDLSRDTRHRTDMLVDALCRAFPEAMAESIGANDLTQIG